jgi:diaminohydroxyphosphoribosylaminopyrimidine deaminase/5-amino-6-(5-phosphoribosylamino)uracil reductase
VHEWRAESGAVAVGIGTALADDPLLTARDVNAARQPTRVVFDSRARLPLGSKLLATLDEAPVIVVCSADAPPERVRPLRGAGADVLALPGEPAARIPAALAELGSRDIDSVLLEGGATLAGAFLDAGELDAARIFIAPILLGGAGSRPALRGADPAAIADGRRALHVDWSPSGDDLLVSARLREW